MAVGETAGNEQRRHAFAGRVIKVDATFIAHQLLYRTPEGQPDPAFVSGIVDAIGSTGKPWHEPKIVTFLNRLMEKQKVT